LRQDNILILFAKAPVVGYVKTRLIPDYSPSQACVIHQQLLEYSLAMLADQPAVDVVLYCAPDQQHSYFQSLQDLYNIKLEDQPPGNLGQKMSTVLSQALLNYKKVVLIGSDIPAINQQYVSKAFAVLDQSPVVIGPAEDGGYVLVGLTAPMPRMFDDIAWGEANVLQQSMEKLQPEIPVLLETLWDVDRPEDVARFLQLKANNSSLP